MIRLDGIIDKEGYKYRSDIYIYIYILLVGEEGFLKKIRGVGGDIEAGNFRSDETIATRVKKNDSRRLIVAR